VVPAVCLRQMNVTEDGQEQRSVTCRSATGARPCRHLYVSRHNLNVTRCGTINQWSVSCMAADTGARPGRPSTSRAAARKTDCIHHCLLGKFVKKVQLSNRKHEILPEPPTVTLRTNNFVLIRLCTFSALTLSAKENIRSKNPKVLWRFLAGRKWTSTYGGYPSGPDAILRYRGNKFVGPSDNRARIDESELEEGSVVGGPVSAKTRAKGSKPDSRLVSGERSQQSARRSQKQHFTVVDASNAEDATVL